MDILDLRNLQLSYQAVYDQDLCESMQDLGLIGEDRAPGVRPYNPGPTQAEVRADAKAAAKRKEKKDKDKEGYGPEEKFKDWKLTSTPSTVTKTGETISQRMNKEAPYKTRPFSPLFTKQGSRLASAVTRATEGPGEPQSVTMPRKKSKPSKEIVRRSKQEESVDLYDVVLDHLLDEGYASTIENAEAIMANMSEEWRDSIFEEKKPLPVTKMKRKEDKLLNNDDGQLQALRTDVGSKERKARSKELQRFDNINSARTSVAKRGGKQQHPMPEVGRFKPKYDDED